MRESILVSEVPALPGALDLRVLGVSFLRCVHRPDAPSEDLPIGGAVLNPETLAQRGPGSPLLAAREFLMVIRPFDEVSIDGQGVVLEKSGLEWKASSRRRVSYCVLPGPVQIVSMYRKWLCPHDFSERGLGAMPYPPSMVILARHPSLCKFAAFAVVEVCD